MGCFSAQMLHELETKWDGKPKGRDPVNAPKSQ
eukprot:CAMPEP_0194040178 /NCGR_PEP_ID=MMETSP0009_2-20130614/12217_1 /TAXON_ID=210454 /ORGANISM="Grammatophora oceanica, Strain CCMP 410" /LENGTH=32 /DNA_ID= /DNA_START= /DNA_END= /DNA_ORIENTATION=